MKSDGIPSWYDYFGLIIVFVIAFLFMLCTHLEISMLELWSTSITKISILFEGGVRER